MANLAVGRPLGEDHLAHERWFHPVRVAAQRAWRRRRKRTRCLLEAIQTRAQVERRLLREAGADLAAEHQAIAFVISDQQRAEAGAHPFRIGEATDHELLALGAL